MIPEKLFRAVCVRRHGTKDLSCKLFITSEWHYEVMESLVNKPWVFDYHPFCKTILLSDINAVAQIKINL